MSLIVYTAVLLEGTCICAYCYRIVAKPLLNRSILSWISKTIQLHFRICSEIYWYLDFLLSNLVFVIIYSPQNRRISDIAQSAISLRDLSLIRLFFRLITILEWDSIQPDSTCFQIPWNCAVRPVSTANISLHHFFLLRVIHTLSLYPTVCF